MALRAEEDNSNSPLPGLSYFWQEAEKPPDYDWEQWVQLFEVAVLARHSISMTELLRVADQQNPRNAAMMGNLDEIPAKRKLVSLMYITIGKTGRKMLMDKFRNTNILLIELQNLVQNCTECFQTRRNRILDRHIFSRESKNPRKRCINFVMR